MRPGTSRDTDGVNAGPAREGKLNPAQPLPPRLASRGGQGARSRERGQSTAEFVVMLLGVFFILFVIIDFTLALRSYITAVNAAREGARLGVVSGGDPTLDTLVENRTVSHSMGLLAGDDVTVLHPDGTDKGDPITVAVDYKHKFIFLGLFMDALEIDVKTSTTMRFE
jgi:hypothetical protein